MFSSMVSRLRTQLTAEVHVGVSGLLEDEERYRAGTLGPRTVFPSCVTVIQYE